MIVLASDNSKAAKHCSPAVILRPCHSEQSEESYSQFACLKCHVGVAKTVGEKATTVEEASPASESPCRGEHCSPAVILRPCHSEQSEESYSQFACLKCHVGVAKTVGEKATVVEEAT